MITVMATNGGPHPPEKWAETTASHIIELGNQLTGENRILAIKLQADIIDALVDSHTKTQEGERIKIKEHGHERLGHPLSPHDHVKIDVIVAKIIVAAKGTPWGSSFLEDGMKAKITGIVLRHMADNMYIERSWHADRNPDTPHAKAFRTSLLGV